MSDALQSPRILFVTPVSPFSTESGSEQRSALMMQALQSAGTVDVLQLSHGPQTQVSVIHKQGQTFIVAQLAGSNLSLQRYAPKQQFTRQLESALQHPMAAYDLVVGRYVWPVCQLALPVTTPVIVDLDDFTYRWSELAPLTWSSFLIRVKKTVSGVFVRRQLSRFTAAFFVSPLDQQQLPFIRSALLPNVPYLTSTPREPLVSTTVVTSEACNVLFVGSLWYAPNAEGINWFLDEVWPSVVRQIPTATLTLVGAAPAKTRQDWERHPQVSAPGFVDDLANAYAKAALVIVPLLSGGGSNIKVLEALTFKRPCLITQFCSATFADQLVADVDLLVANSAEEFVNKAVDCLKNPLQYASLSAAGSRSVGLKFSAKSLQDTVLSMTHHILSRSRPC